MRQQQTSSERDGYRDKIGLSRSFVGSGSFSNPSFHSESFKRFWGVICFKNRLSDFGVSSQQKIDNSEEGNLGEELEKVTHKVYFDIEVGGKPTGIFCKSQFALSS